MSSPDIHTYLDFREFLKDWFDTKKQANPKYSHRLFARKAGLKSPALLANVVSGRRNLTSSSAESFCDAMGLGKVDRRFFHWLVQLDQARTEEEKREAWEHISASRRFRAARQIDSDSVEYLSHWYFPAIRELATCAGFRPDPAWISRTLRPQITEAQARRALETLVSLGLLIRDSSGNVEVSEASVVTPMEVVGMAVQNYHRGMLERAAESMTNFGPDERYLGGVTVSIPASQLPALKSEMTRFQERLLDLCDSASDPRDRVYQLGLQIFPLSTESGADK